MLIIFIYRNIIIMVQFPKLQKLLGHCLPPKNDQISTSSALNSNNAENAEFKEAPISNTYDTDTLDKHSTAKINLQLLLPVS